MAIPNEVATDPAVTMFTANAPMKIAGHASVPSRSTAAIAIPVGGHTAVALAFTKARRSPSFAAMK